VQILVIQSAFILLEEGGFLCLVTNRVCALERLMFARGIFTFLSWRLCCHTTASEVYSLQWAQGLAVTSL